MSNAIPSGVMPLPLVTLMSAPAVISAVTILGPHICAALIKILLPLSSLRLTSAPAPINTFTVLTLPSVSPCLPPQPENTAK